MNEKKSMASIKEVAVKIVRCGEARRNGISFIIEEVEKAVKTRTVERLRSSEVAPWYGANMR